MSDEKAPTAKERASVIAAHVENQNDRWAVKGTAAMQITAAEQAARDEAERPYLKLFERCLECYGDLPPSIQDRIDAIEHYQRTQEPSE